MSRHVAQLVYSRKCGGMARKAVLAYFAERANDDGTDIWASKQRIADEIECSKQTVIATVKALQADGLIMEAGKRKTQGGYTVVYNIDLAALAALPQTKAEENQSNQLTTSIVEPVKPVDPFTSQIAEPVKPLDPDQSNHLTQTVHEPSFEEEAKASPSRAKANPFPKPDWADPQVWADWIDVRRTKKARNTPTGYAGFLTDIANLTNEEWPPGRLLEYAVRKSWAGIYQPKEDYPSAGRNQQQRPKTNGANLVAPDGRAMGRTEAAARAAVMARPGNTGGSRVEPLALPDPLRAHRHVAG